MVVRFYSSIAAETTLVGGITNSATSITIASATGLPASFPYTLALDYESASEELVDVTAAAGTTLTVTRGVDGTSGTAHGNGARVRHVSSGRDFRDSRDHENDIDGVHGLGASSAVVGTADPQTLTNKTLTSPTINSGSLSGTFSGNHTYSGEISHTNLYRGSRAASGDSQMETRVTGDAFARWFNQASGQMNWGTGAAGTDVNLYRGGSNTLATDDQLRISRASSTDPGLSVKQDADASSRGVFRADGRIQFGDGTGLLDIGLFRDSAATLRTTSNFVIDGNLSVSGIGREISVYKTADTARASTTTRTPDPHLAVSLPANTTWVVDGYIKYMASTVADLSLAWDWPGDVSNATWSMHAPDTTATGDPSSLRVIETNTTGARAYGGYGSTTGIGGFINGSFETGPTGGTFGLSWAQATSDPVATTLSRGSWLRFRRIV